MARKRRKAAQSRSPRNSHRGRLTRLEKLEDRWAIGSMLVSLPGGGLTGLLPSLLSNESLLAKSILPESAAGQEGSLFTNQSFSLPGLLDEDFQDGTSSTGTGASSTTAALNDSEDDPPINTLGNSSFDTLGNSDWLAGSQASDSAALQFAISGMASGASSPGTASSQSGLADEAGGGGMTGGGGSGQTTPSTTTAPSSFADTSQTDATSTANVSESLDSTGEASTPLDPPVDNSSTASLAPPAPTGGSPVVIADFPADLAGWTVEESGGLQTPGSVVEDNGDAVMREGDSFLVTLEHTFEVPDDASELAFTYADLSFDTTDPSFINDAFEVALLDADGYSLVDTTEPGRDVFFNISEGLPAALGSGTTVNGQTVTVDMTGVLPGETATLVFRLVNNDSDTASSVRILGVGIPGADQPPEVTVDLENDTAPEGPGTDAYRTDRLTNDPTVFGSVADDLGVVLLEARVDGNDFVDITGLLESGEYRFDPGALAPGPHSITVRVTDTGEQTAEASTEFTVNVPPIANAGGNRTVGEGTTVDFDGSGSTDTEAAIFAYRWTLDGGNTVDAVTASRHYPQEGLFTLSLTVTDTAGSVHTDTIDVTVANLPPQVDAVADRETNEGQTLSFTTTFADPGVLDTHTATIDWGDGTVEPTPVVEQGGAGTVSGSHVYLDDGTYNVTVTVTDDAQAIGETAFAVKVNNLAPVVLTATDLTGDEGESLDFLGTFSDAGILDTHTASVHWSDGTTGPGTVTEANGLGSVTASHTYADNGVYPIKLVVTDNGDASGEGDATATVANIAPIVTARDNQTLDEGATLDGVVATFVDPGFTSLLAGSAETFTATIDWGDQTPLESGTLSVAQGSIGVWTSGSVSGTHTYVTAGVYTVTISVMDDDEGAGSDSFEVAVREVGELEVTADDLSGLEGQQVAFAGAFSHANPSGTRTATIDWGDGTTSPGNVNESGGQGSVTASHTYADNGSYSIRLDVTDSQELTATAYATANIANLAPALTAYLAYQGYAVEGDQPLAVEIWGEFTDPGFDRPEAGTQETFVLSIDWGDGTVEQAAFDLTMGSAGTDTHGSYQVLHTYEESGVYDARVTVVDDDGGVDAADLHYGLTRIDVKPAVKNPAWDPIDDSDADTSLVHGLIPVIIPSGPNFDATQINVDTLRFFPGYAPEYNLELLEFDVTGDGLVDAIAHFSTWAARIRPSDDVCYITGELNDGTYFSAFDAIRVTGASGRIPDATNPPDAAASDTKFFVVDSQADSTFRYRADGSANDSFPLESIVTDARGVTANATGDTLWVVDGTNHLVEVHGPDGWLLGSWLAEGLDQPEGIATDGTDIWIVDAGLDQVLHYTDAATLRSMSAAPDDWFTLHTKNVSPSGITTDGQTLWVVDDAADQVFVYDVAGTHLGSWNLDPDNADPSGITNDPTGGTDLWVVDREDLLVYHYDTVTSLTAGVAPAADTFALAAANVSPEGIADPPAGDVDLTIGELDTSGLVYDGQSLMVSGQIAATIADDGTGDVTESFEVLFFEDRDGDGAYSADVDNALGSTLIGGLLASRNLPVSVQISGQVEFAGNVIWGFVDSRNAIAEADEANNVSRPQATFIPEPGQFNPVVEWSKSTFSVAPNSNQVVMTPLVIDLDLDGNPDVVFITYSGGAGMTYLADGILRAISGKDGTELWSVTDPAYGLYASGLIAAGDIDNDGFPEILAPHENHYLLAFEHDGNFKWKNEDVSPFYPSIADLDHDGVPEIVTASGIINSDGTLRWRNTQVSGFDPIVADLDLDGSPEVVLSGGAFHADGTLYWGSNWLGSGFPAVADFDDDGFPEVLVMRYGGGGQLYLLEHSGDVKWGPVYVPGAGGYGGPPVIADFDGDGEPEIGIAGKTLYVALETDGTVKWTSPIDDDSSGFTGSSVFDFDGDGSAEVVYRDEWYLRVYRGTDGAVLYKTSASSNTGIEMPIVADVDADGDAEIVFGANDAWWGSQHGIYVIGDANDSWVPTRQIWNQHSYHITNVNDDGTIPAHEENSWEVHNTYRLNAQPGLDPHAAPDLTASYLRASGDELNANLTARIGNGGELFVVAGVPVAFYDDDPQNGGTLLGATVTTTRLEPGQFEDVSIVVPQATIADREIWVVADDDGTGRGTVSESDEVNNVHHARIQLSTIQIVTESPDDGAGFPAGTEVLITGWAGSKGVLPGTDPGPITFETIPGGAPVDGMTINAQFLQTHGVTFSLEGGGAPVLAQVGSPRTAFEGYQLGDDAPAPGQNVGQFFLTDDGNVAGPPDALIITYTTPVSAASGVILDIDEVTPVGIETWRIEGRNADGVVIAATEIGPDTPGAGDALATFWSIQHSTREISSVRIAYTGTKSVGVGLAFDNFSPASALPITVDRSIKAVMVNGRPVDALDAAGNFFTSVTVQPGENIYEFTAIDALGQTASTILTLEGTQYAGGQVNLKFDASTSFQPDYARTSFDERNDLLHAQMAIENIGQYEADTPFYVGVINVSEPTVSVGDAAGVTDDGIPYYNLSELVPGDSLSPEEITGYVDATFHNPQRLPFTYDLVFLIKTNDPPEFTSVPIVETYAGWTYDYDSEAIDPDDDPLTYSLLLGPETSSIDPSTGQLTWLPALADLGAHTIVIRAEDGRGGTAEQRYLLSVVEAPPNRPPYFTSVPVTEATAQFTPEKVILNFEDLERSDQLEGQYADLGVVFTHEGIAGTVVDFVEHDFGHGDFGSSPSQGTSIGGEVPIGSVLGITVQQGFSVEPFADVDSPLSLAFPPDASSFGSDLFVSAARVLDSAASQTEDDYIYRVSPSGEVSEFVALLPETDPVAIEFSTPDGAFGDFLFVSGNNRDGGRPVDQGGTILRVDSTGAVSDFSAVGLPDGPGEPGGIEFGPGGAYGTDLFVANSSDLPADILRVDPSGTTTPFVDDGITGWYVGLAAHELHFGPADGSEKLLYFTDQGGDGDPYTAVLRTVDATGQVSDPIATPPGVPLALAFSPGGPFGTELYIAVQVSDVGSIYRLVDGSFQLFATGFQGLSSRCLEFSPDGSTLYVVDRTADAVYRIGAPEGVNKSVARFIDKATGEPSTSSFVSLRVGDGDESSESFRVSFYGTAGQLLNSQSYTTAASGNVGVTVTYAHPEISRVEVESLDFFDTLMFDDFTFNEVGHRFGYIYDSDAVDPDLDPVSYSLLEAPDGMQIDPATGLVTWAPTVEQLEMTDEPAADPTLPVMPGFTVEVYADVTDPVDLSFDTLGNLFVGRDNSGSGGTVHDAVKIHRVSVGGGVGEEYGSTVIADPDAVFYDTTGEFSGAAGAVLVGLTAPILNPARGQLVAILPNGQIVERHGPSSDYSNPTRFLMDYSGRLLFTDHEGPLDTDDGQVMAIWPGGAPLSLFTVPSRRISGIAVDRANRIFTSDVEGTIRIHDSGGTLLDDAFATGLGGAVPIAFGIGGAWSNDLYAIDATHGRLLRFDSAGNSTILASGFDGSVSDLQFGPDGALYVSQFDNDRILRIAPNRETLGLAPNEHPVTIAASDGRGGADQQTFVVQVKSTGNHPPVIVSEPLTTMVPGATYAYDVDAIDPDADPITYSLTEYPDGMTIDAATGLIEWTPSADWLTENEVVFSDGTFNSADWTTSEFVHGGGGGVTITPHSTGGHPDRYLMIVATVNAAATNADTSWILRFEERQGATYEPEEQGAVFSIDYSYDVLTSFSPSQQTSPLLAVKQDGRLYITGIQQPRSQDWQTANLSGLRKEDFSLVDPQSWFAQDPTQHPDFSVSGSVLQFGYAILLRNSFGGGSYDKAIGLDNWRVCVTPVAQSDVSVRAEDGRGGYDDQSYVVKASHGGEIHGYTYNDLNTDRQWDRGPVLLVGHSSSHSEVVQHDLSNGAMISKFVTPNPGVVEVGPDGDIYVSQYLSGEVLRYHGETGQFKDVFIGPGSGVVGAHDLAFGADGNLYLASDGTDSVLRFDGATGEFIDVFASGRTSDLFQGIAFGPDGNLYVVEASQDRVLRFNGQTGQFVDAFVLPGSGGLDLPTGLAFGLDGSLYVSSAMTEEVLRYDGNTGEFIDTFVTEAAGGLQSPGQLLFGPDNMLYVTSFNTRTVLRYNATTGAFVDTFAASEQHPYYLALLPGATNVMEPGLPGWTIYIDLNRNYRRDDNEPVTVTDENGHYSFDNLAAGTYVVAEVPQVGWAQSAPVGRRYEITVESGQTVYNVDFGNYQSDTAEENLPPDFTSVPPTEVDPGDLLRYDAVAVDPNGDPLTFDLVLKPDGMTVHPQRGVVVWQPTLDQVGAHQVVLRVRDGRGGVDLQSFSVEVLPPNSAPVITSTPVELAVADLPYVYQATAQDAEGDAVSFRLGGTPPDGMQIDPGTGRLTWTPAVDQVAIHNVTVVASDGELEASQAFTLEVVATAPNDPPQITSTPRKRARLGSQYVYVVEAADPNADPLGYHLDSPPPGMTIDNAGVVRWQPTAGQLGDNPVNVRVEDGRGGSVTQSFSLEVVTTDSNTAPWVTSNPPTTGLVGRTYKYDLTARDAEGDPVVWSLDTAPTGMSIDPLRGTLRWTPSAEQTGPVNVVVRVQDVFFASSTQSFTINVRSRNLPPAIISAAPTQASLDELYVYPVRAIDPDGDPLEFQLAVGPQGMTIDPETGFIQWTPIAGQEGRHTVRVTVEDGQGGFDAQSYVVEIAVEPGNRPPIINSTPVYAATSDRPYQYAVTAADPDGDTPAFTLERFPAGMQIDPASGLITWTPSAAQEGDHTVTVVATDPDGARGTQSFAVVASPNQAPTITSTPVETVTAGATYAYDVWATDPENDPLTFALDTAPAGMSVDSFGRIRWQPTIADLAGSPHAVEVTVTDAYGASSAPQTFTVDVIADTKPPAIQMAVSTNLVDPGGQVRIQVRATDNVGVETVQVTLDGQPISFDFTGTFGETWLTMDSPGLFDIVATAADAAGNRTATDPWMVRVIDTSDQEYPQVEIHALQQGDVRIEGNPLHQTPTITYLADVIASISDENLEFWRVDYARTDRVDLNHLAADDPDYVTIAQGTADVSNAIVATFDPTLLANDGYVIRVIAGDLNGLVTSRGVTVGVAGEAKLGNFHLDFTDLQLPLAGIPITITRSYDTLNADVQGDFGYGWNLGLQDGRILETVPTGQSFQVGTRVYITNPAGRRVGFTFEPTLVGSLFGTYWIPKFTPDPGVTDKLAVYESQAGPPGSIWAGLGGPYNPDRYKLTTADGTLYEYDQSAGLQKITDRNGTTLTFTDDGVYHSTAGAIEFIRDNRGRIQQIVGPPPAEGDDPVIVSYEYDLNRDLVAFTDQGDNVTRYTYLNDPAHFLDTIIGPNGITIFDAEFDEDGRLTSSTDALGNSVSQDFDLEAMKGTITDAKQNVTWLLYDELGNVLEEEDPLGGITKYEYADVRHPNLETTITDRNGVIEERVYDAKGNVTLVTRAAGTADESVTAYAYNSRGDVTGIQTNDQPPTTFAYDTKGNLGTITNATGNAASATYDSLGRQTSFTDFNGNTTVYDYKEGCPCGSPRLVTYADGTYEEYAYNRYSQITQHQVFEADGMLAEFSSTQYDIYGRPIREQWGQGDDRMVKTSAYEFANLISETIVPPTDPSQNRVTRYEYDDAQRVIKQTDAEGGGVEFQYDANGNRIYLKDPVGNVTTWLYDELDRVVEERDPFYTPPVGETRPYQAPTRSVPTDPLAEYVRYYEYDAEGNQTAKIDRNARRTEFGYDNLSRLTDERWYEADGTQTHTITSAYNVDGYLVSITDTDLLTSTVVSQYTYTYDTLGRMTSEDNAGTADMPHVVLSYEYDDMGNVEKTSDNLGTSVVSEYDARNRLSTQLWDGPEIDPARVDFLYTAAGRESRMDRYSGLTRDDLVASTEYLYDTANRTRQISHRRANDEVIAQYDYQYDFAGLLSRENRSGDSYANADWAADYTYDRTGQLTDAVYTGSDVIPEQVDEYYRYDANGNRTESYLHGTGYVTGTANQLLSDGTFNYDYDLEGNMVRKTEIATGEVTTFDYNQRNRMVRAVKWSSNPDSGGIILSEEEYTYDAHNRRIRILTDADGPGSGAAEETKIVYTGDNAWADFNAAGEVKARYLLGNRIDQILAQHRQGQGTSWHLTSMFQTVRDIVNSLAQPQNHIEYATFGQPILQTNSAFPNRFMFTAREYDPQLAMYYYRARFYDIHLARFVSMDQIGFEAGDVNLYRYVQNSPGLASDPHGASLISYLISATPAALILGGLGAIAAVATGDCYYYDPLAKDIVFIPDCVSRSVAYGFVAGLLIGFLGAALPIAAAIVVGIAGGAVAGRPQFQEALERTAGEIAARLGIPWATDPIKVALLSFMKAGKIDKTILGKIALEYLK